MFPEQFSLILDQELLMVCCHLQPSAAQQIVQGTVSKAAGAIPLPVRRQRRLFRSGRHGLHCGWAGPASCRTELCFPFPRLALLALLFDGVQHTPEANFLHPAIPALAAYDRKHGTDLLTTLRVYVKHLGKSSSTVKELHIHRNSLPYRLGKIQQITGYSLEDFQTVLHLAVNFYWLNWETDDPKRG